MPGCYVSEVLLEVVTFLQLLEIGNTRHDVKITVVDDDRVTEHRDGCQLAQLVVDQESICSAAFGSSCIKVIRTDVTSSIITRRSLASRSGRGSLAWLLAF